MWPGSQMKSRNFVRDHLLPVLVARKWGFGWQTLGCEHVLHLTCRSMVGLQPDDTVPDASIRYTMNLYFQEVHAPASLQTPSPTVMMTRCRCVAS